MKIDLLTKQAINHTLHCLLGCSIGEITGMVIGTSLNWSNTGTVAISIILAFLFGYLLTLRSVSKREKNTVAAVKITLATDTASITSMEILDNTFILLVPGAMDATLSSVLFWWSLLISLLVAFVLTVPVNRWMMARSGGHTHHH